MDSMLGCVCCPVCNLYLRDGLTLPEHLNTHPKEQVIDALVRYSGAYGDGPSKQYQEFVDAIPRVTASMGYPVFSPGGAGGPGPQDTSHPDVDVDPLSVRTPPPSFPELVSANTPQSECGANCVSNCRFDPLKQDMLKVEYVRPYDSEETNWTPVATPVPVPPQEYITAEEPAPEPEQPTNLCLRQSSDDSSSTQEMVTVAWGRYPAEMGHVYQPRQLVHNGQILRSGGGTIVEAGEGRTLLNLSEPGPMSAQELEGVHFLVPSQFIGNPAAADSAQDAVQMARQDNPGGVSTEGVAAAPPAYSRRAPSPDMDVVDIGPDLVAESPCSAVDSAPSSPFVQRVDSPINIRSDETMPAHGEISEQESVGGNSSSMWPDQNFSSMKEQHCYEQYKGPEVAEANVESTVRFVGQPMSFASSLPPSVAGPGPPTPNPMTLSTPPPPLGAPLPLSDDLDKEKKPVRVPKCRWCRLTFARRADRRAHICDKRKGKGPPMEASTSDMQVQKPKRIYKKKPKENGFEIRLKRFADVLVSQLEEQEQKVEVSDSVPEPIRGSGAVDANADLGVDAGAEAAVDPLKNFKCDKCDEEFISYRLMAIHRWKEHKNCRYECSTCSEAFELEAKYHAHLMVHPLECNLCGKFFYRRKNLALHMRRHMSIKPYKCEHCDKSFVTKQKLDEHSNIHTGNAPIKCPLCDQTFRRHSNLVQHKNRHHFNVEHKKKDFICHCGEVFHTKKKLEWHKEIHDEKPKSCTFCNERFVHSSSLTRHVRKAHDERYVPKVGREVENVQCVVCQSVCLKSSLTVHMRTHSGARPYPCNICGKSFTTKWNLQLHRWTHASRSTKPFKCTMCKSAFHRRSDFTSHVRSHRNVRPYTCNFCGCQFIRKYNCIRHMNEHEKSKSHTCGICEKTFHRSYYLKEHMRVHNKTRPYSCHICGKASSSKSNHNKHVKIHHAREPQNTEG